MQTREIVPAGDPPAIVPSRVNISGGCPFSGRRQQILTAYGRARHRRPHRRVSEIAGGKRGP